MTLTPHPLALIIIFIFIALAKRIAHLPRYADPRDEHLLKRGSVASTGSSYSTDSLGGKGSDEKAWSRHAENFTHHPPPTPVSSRPRSTVEDRGRDKPELPRLPGQAFVPLSAMQTHERPGIRSYLSTAEFGLHDAGRRDKSPSQQRGLPPRPKSTGNLADARRHSRPTIGYRVPSFPSSRVPYAETASTNATRAIPRPAVRGVPRNLTSLPPLRPALKNGGNGHLKPLRLAAEGEGAPRFPSGLGTRAYATTKGPLAGRGH